MASSLRQIPYQNRDQVLACKPCAETWFSFVFGKYNWSFKLLPVNTRKRLKIMAFLYSTCLYVSISCLEIKVGYEYRSSIKYIHLISAHSNIDSCVKNDLKKRNETVDILIHGLIILLLTATVVVRALGRNRSKRITP